MESQELKGGAAFAAVVETVIQNNREQEQDNDYTPRPSSDQRVLLEPSTAELDTNTAEHTKAAEDKDTKEGPHHDSMVTVRLSEPPKFQVVQAEAIVVNDEDFDCSDDESPDSPTEEQEDSGSEADTVYESSNIRSTMDFGSREVEDRRGSDASSIGSSKVNWEELERTEASEPKDQLTDDVSIPCLLLIRQLLTD
jgi:hypothetical protein